MAGAEPLTGTRVAAVVVAEAPEPRIFWEDHRIRTRTAYAALRVTAAVNLLEDRVYGELDRQARISTLLREEQSFLSALRDQRIPAAFDLRMVIDPGQAVPVDVAILVRAWAPGTGSGSSRPPDEVAADVVAQLRAGLPRHAVAEEVQDDREVLSLLRPFGPQDRVSSAVITKREILGIPQRPDAKVGYYFSVLPFNWAESD